MRRATATLAAIATCHVLGCDFPKLSPLEDVPDAPVEPLPTNWGLLMANARTRDGLAAEPIRAYILNDQGVYKAAWQSDELDWGRSVSWGDFDKDGRTDFAIGNGYLSRGKNRIYRNDGNGSFQVYWTAATGAYTSFVTWADVDGDQDLDLVGILNDVYIYRNNAGVFESIPELLLESEFSLREIKFADSDRDGDLDALVASSGGVFLYRNDGQQGFREVWRSPPEDGASIEWADFDKDGDLDFAAGFQRGLRIFQQGNGTFSEVFSTLIDLNPGITAASLDIDWLDYDNDKDFDLIAAHCEFVTSTCEPTQSRLYKNSGSTFSVGWIADEIESSESVSVADYDGDGYTDLALGSITGLNRVYRNIGGSFMLKWTAPESELTNDIAWIPFP